MQTVSYPRVLITKLRGHTAKQLVSLRKSKLADNAELDPNSYLNFYKRATAYLSLGRHSAALEDFESILRLNPSFAQVSFRFLVSLTSGASPKSQNPSEGRGF